MLASTSEARRQAGFVFQHSGFQGPTRPRPVSNNLILAFVGEHVLGLPRSY
jgi:hypothetical protein